MGLDMYLNKKVYVGAVYKHNNITGILELAKEDKPIPINLSKVTEVTEQVAYWRKANQIHYWFVQNVQNGKDNCDEYEVTIDNLKKLVSTCKEVLAEPSKARDLLPTSSGFFFGSTEYDEYYFQDLRETVEMLEPILKEIEDNPDHSKFYNFYYQSSW